MLRHRISTFTITLSIGCSLLAVNAASADIWDLKADWSDARNRNAAWSYRAGENLLPSQPNYTPNQPAWATNPFPQPFHIPVWWRLAAPSAWGDWLVGDVGSHSNDFSSGNGVDLANVTWTSPTNFVGDVAIDGGLWHISDGDGRSNDWRLSLNGNLLASGTIGSGDPFSRADPNTFAIDTPIAQGDVIMLEIEKAPASQWGAWAGMNLTIEGTPAVCDPCDMNCDGIVNAFDIEPFLELLFNGGVPCDTCTGDVDGNGLIDAFDIEPFLNCLFP